MPRIKENERPIDKKENANGGIGYIIKHELLDETKRGEHCALYGKVILNKDCEVGVHKHVGETETYYIVKGSGTYYDNDETYEVVAGDVTFCDDGSTHGLLNTSDEPLELIALILKK